VESLERSIKKLSQLSESLSILTKIENYEFADDQTTDLSKLISESIEEFREFIIFNNIKIQADIKENVKVQIHPALADVLWTNLFQNAIKHNVDNGIIKVILTDNELVISNTGEPLSIDPDQLFERFRKADQNSSSIGLGLSIIERIADQNQLNIDYTNKNEWHTIQIELNHVKTT
jgi:signal transduction histidine kinase